MSEFGLADFAPQNILALGAEPQRALAVLMEPVDDIYRMVGWQTVDLAPQASPNDYPTALIQAVTRLESQFSISLWDAEQDRPRLHSPQPVLADGAGQVTAVADLLPPLEVWMAGLSGGASLAAGEEALAGALCNLVAAYRHSPHWQVSDLAVELLTLLPDVILIVGGYEQRSPRSQKATLELCRHVTDAAAQLPAERRPFFCFAGNSRSVNSALAYWQALVGDSAAEAADNVLVAAGPRSETALHRVLARYHRQRSLELPAMRRIGGWVDHPAELRSAQWAFGQAVRLWRGRQQLPELHGLYAGADRWLHVWASDDHDRVDGGLRICCVRPGDRPGFLADWPPLRLVSGAWPSQWPRPSIHWWDPLGFVPVVVSAGQIAPQAAVQVLAADILEGSASPIGGA